MITHCWPCLYIGGGPGATLGAHAPQSAGGQCPPNSLQRQAHYSGVHDCPISEEAMYEA